MEKSVLVSIDNTYATNGGIFIPSDYLQIRQITFNDQYELQKEDVSVVVPLSYYEKGMPRVYCRRGGVWVLAPMPEVAATPPYDTVRVDYYAEFSAMSAINDTTVLTDIASDLMVFGALSYACDHYSDKRGDKFEARYQQIFADIQGMGDDDETSGSAAVQPAYFYSDDLDGTL